MSISGERRKYFKGEARSLLRYNYPKQVFMVGITILLAFGINAAKISVIKLFGLEYSFFSMPVNMFFDLLSVFVIIPLYIGIIYVNIKLFEGENVPVGGMFHYFSSPANLLDCYKFITAIAARFIAFALPFLFIGAFFPLLRDLFEIILPKNMIRIENLGQNLGEYGALLEHTNINADIAMLGASLVYLIAFIVCIVIFMRYFPSVFIFVKNPCLSVREIFRKSAKMMKKRKLESLKLILSFSIWIMISHYLAGFMYMFFTLPYMMLSYASFMSFVLSEKGGEDFLTAAYDYIAEKPRPDKKAKKNGKPKGIMREYQEEREEREAAAVKVIKLRRGEIFDRFKKIKNARKKQIG